MGALLSASRASGDLKIAERISQHIVQLDFDDPGYYVLVANVYAALGRWDDVRMIRKSIKYEKVNKLLGTLANLMAKEGYVADLQYALHDVEEDEKRGLLYGHSERLAIAFGLLNTEPGTPYKY
ncbi:hypothetical protein GH714_021329 [Hevea brasiliensis]|uniref:DYW domain-containing protein n=1 Tax=Hevea brasiliensis TaxID=3981 RepID=A0A6A6M2N3_HEVBR|nr:hypothetical protein GH714_021329 [Hevea brasiliensis]